MKRVFPLSREFYEDFTYYYPFGNSPPEDFLQSVSTKDSREPTVLSLGCGDMRSPMFTILNNFGLEGKAPDAGFNEVHFVLNDHNATILARNILFLYLSMLLPDPGSGDEKNKWLASVWSLWYNHELQPEHNEMLLSALEELCRWSISWQEWSKCPLGKVVKFASPATFAGVKKVWCKWQSFKMSVKDMKQQRNHFQFYQMKKRGCQSREEGLTKYLEFNILLKRVLSLYSTTTFSKIKKEYLEYLRDGFVWGETVLGIPIGSPKTVVNPTLFEHASGMYTLHYELTPYMGFILSFLYKKANIDRTVRKFLPVSNAQFKSSPLLADCVQQFSMWLQATANVMKKSSSVSFTFVLEDSISLCFSWTKMLRFDAIYTSNLIDHVSPPALVLNALPLLKPTGTLFTETFPTEFVDHYLELNFIFSPELFPVFLGVHCIGHDGPYSPAIKHDPNPQFLYTSKAHSSSLIWRNVTTDLLIFKSIQESQQAFGSLFKSCCIKSLFSGVDNTGSVESFLCVLHQFLRQVQFTIPVHEFLQPLCDAIKSEECLKPHLIQLQTQSLLHDIHMHLTFTEADCPVCRGQPLDTYIQQFTLSLDIDSLNMQPYNPPAFEIQLASSLGDLQLAILKSYSISYFESKLDLTFFLPKHYLAQFSLLRVQMHQSLQQGVEVYCGPIQNLFSATHDYVFMKRPSKIANDGDVCPLGHIAKHVGDADMFETEVFMSDACLIIMKESKLVAECLEETQLQLQCGELKWTISYPYPIDESKTHIKISKKNRTISVVVKREGCRIFNEKPIYLVDQRNSITHPNFHLGDDKMEMYCNLQLQYNRPDHPLYNAKQSFTELLKHAWGGQKVFTLSFPSKRFANSPDVYALVYVHNLRFNTVFSSPALEVSYCFLDTKPKHLIPDFNRLANYQHSINSLGAFCSIIVNDAEYKFLKDLFKYFSSTIRCPFPNDLNTITKSIEDHKLWEHFDHAILFPLYPNPANLAYQKFIIFLNGVGATSGIWLPSDLAINQVLTKGQLGRSDACSFCQAFTVPLKCEQCQRASYCSRECLDMHWRFHNVICNKVKQDEYMVSLKKTTTSSKFVQGTDSCADTVSKREEASMKDVRSVPSIGSQCARCKKPAVILCQCQQVFYCSKECQTLEWPGHREKCQPPPNSMTTGNGPSSSSSAETKKELKVPTGKPKPHLPQKTSATECERCKKPATITCQCKQVSYCSEACKTLEWPVHSKACRKMADTHKPHTPEKSKGVTDSESPKKVYVAQKCYNCGKTKSSLKHCKCGNALYCSVECQRLHWSQHKTTCTTLRK